MKKPVTIRARVQQVFIVDGLRKIAERTATILVCGKATHAEVYDREGIPRRRRLGTRAFFTLKDAEMRKLAELRKMAALGNIWSLEQMAASARQQLAHYADKGTFH